MNIKEAKIAVIGLGYVGLPLAVEFAKKYSVLGFDINKDRVEELSKGEDKTKEANLEALNEVIHSQTDQKLTFSSTPSDLEGYNVFIVTVPTPIGQFKTPNLEPLKKASEMVGEQLGKGAVVIYESTVYPGCTEEECVPVLEKISGMQYNKDFYCGYSPERINPGDKVNTLVKIKKVTSGSTPEIADFVDELYKSIIEAGTHKAPNIKVAEASKAIENAQRDVNISFVNELALIFDRVGIDTHDVLEAAATKWNFLKYSPGLVGGHCIGVDPYYLAHKAEALGYHPEVILSGRRVNDNMGMFVANKTIKLMIQNGRRVKGAKILILGITFKENCPDIRNTRVVDIHKEFTQFGCDVDVYDPWANAEEVKEEYGIDLISTPLEGAYKAIILAVAHAEFKKMNLEDLKEGDAVVFDTKAFLDRNKVDGRL
ncbi:MAG: Vi polysaccharide biosynthesis protein VipA/TviB [Crocinitomicaceae bacterium]|nr:Vi polysaccharide biosynthesis protein VipA/TviB [Crocinitomicaceae bacterium]